MWEKKLCKHKNIYNIRRQIFVGRKIGKKHIQKIENVEMTHPGWENWYRVVVVVQDWFALLFVLDLLHSEAEKNGILKNYIQKQIYYKNLKKNMQLQSTPSKSASEDKDAETFLLLEIYQ